MISPLRRVRTASDSFCEFRLFSPATFYGAKYLKPRLGLFGRYGWRDSLSILNAFGEGICIFYTPLGM